MEPREQNLPPKLESRDSKETLYSHIGEIIFYSFFFSQGNISLQTTILQCIGFQENFIFSDDDKKAIAANASSRIRKFLQKGGGTIHPNNVNIEDEINRIQNYIDFLKQKDRITDIRDEKQMMYKIVEEMIEKDYDYLIDSSRSRVGISGKSIFADPYLSHLCYFVINGREVPLDEYNKLFSKLRETLSESIHLESGLNSSRLKAVVGAYNQTHPEDQVDSSFLK